MRFDAPHGVLPNAAVTADRCMSGLGCGILGPRSRGEASGYLGLRPRKLAARAMTEKSNPGHPITPWGFLPPRMRVLCITTTPREGSDLASVLATDTATEVVLHEAVGASEGMALLRDEIFDAVLINHHPPELDALEVLDGVRAGSSDDQPIIVLGSESEQELLAPCFESGADGYLCTKTATIRSLLWLIARAVERHRLLAENRRFAQDHKHRRQLEHDESSRLLLQQRELIESVVRNRMTEAASIVGHSVTSAACQTHVSQLPSELWDHYREMLRTYVIMGSGGLHDEVKRLAQLLVSSEITSQQVMQLHLAVLERMVQDLGSRSARHVMNRADLLLLEILLHLAEGFRQVAIQRSPEHQEPLTGIDLASGTV